MPLYKVIADGVRFQSATREGAKPDPSMPDPVELVFFLKARSCEVARENIETFMTWEDLIFERVRVIAKLMPDQDS